MEVKFYCDAGKPLWGKIEHQICDNIIGYVGGHSTPKFYIHFDKMLYSIGWFVGYVEIWKGRTPYEKNKRRIPFTAKVWDWGTINNRKYDDYRTHVGVHGIYGAGA
jgi:hypothetical protein